MITLKQYSSKTRIPDADYVLEKTDKLYDIIELLTPKFKGNWEIILIDPKLSFAKELINSQSIPEWVNIAMYLGNKKIENIVLEHPEFQPKEMTKKEAFNEMLKNVTHVVDEKAKQALLGALSHDLNELSETLTKLDKECVGERITLKQVQSVVNYTKRVYASDVINAFLLGDSRRWKLYESLVKEIGQEISYYAMYKYVKTLLLEKEAFLQNKDVKQFIVKKVDAPLLCYVYSLFANSSSHTQLYGLLYSIDHRSHETLWRVQQLTEY